MMPTPPPIWQYATQGHHWFQQPSTGGLGRAGGAVCRRAGVEDDEAPRRPGPHVAWLGTVGHGARTEQGRPVPRAWAWCWASQGAISGWTIGRPMTCSSRPQAVARIRFHLHPHTAMGMDPEYASTSIARMAKCMTRRMWYGSSMAHVEAFALYRSPMACINVVDADALREARRVPGCHVLIGRSLTAPEKCGRSRPAGVHFRELAAVTIAAALSPCLLYHVARRRLAAVWHFLAQHGSFA